MHGSVLETGVTLGHKHIPIDRVGLYIPGGRYPIIAAACMQSVTAKAAGCRSIVACTPTRPDVLDADGQRQPHPYVVSALHLGGVEEIHCVGGIQAVGMMAHGTDNVDAVDFLCGPGNAFVAEAKLQLFGKVSICACVYIQILVLGLILDTHTHTRAHAHVYYMYTRCFCWGNRIKWRVELWAGGNRLVCWPYRNTSSVR